MNAESQKSAYQRTVVKEEAVALYRQHLVLSVPTPIEAAVRVA
jgi:hypothetical protein